MDFPTLDVPLEKRMDPKSLDLPLKLVECGIRGHDWGF
jgi:hypothetical protein